MEIVFVHGAFVREGAWWWRQAGELIDKATGVKSRSVLLPSCGETSARGGLVEDAAALSAVLGDVDEAVVVAHSYGGTVAAQAGGFPWIRQLVYVSSYLPDEGESQVSLTANEPNPLPIRDNGDGTVSIDSADPVAFGGRFWADVADDSVRKGAWDRLTSQSLAALTTPTTDAAWHTVESTYVICADDRSTSLDLQRFHASRATQSFELRTSHHPFLSRPDLVADVIERIVT